MSEPTEPDLPTLEAPDGGSRNVLGTALEECCRDPLTGWFRTGSCDTGPDDHGRHVVCAQMTDEFLAFSRSRGNDLSAPMPAAGFPGLRRGDRWCLCAARWLEAHEAGVAPPVFLLATEESALEIIDLETLQSRALDIH